MTSPLCGIRRSRSMILEPHFQPGTMVVADNADWSPDYLARVRSTDSEYLSVPFADDVELSMKLA